MIKQPKTTVEEFRTTQTSFKRIALHILFWAFYVLFFGSIYGKYGNDFQWYILESVCMLPFVMAATYLTIYLILPNYLKKRHIWLSMLLVLFVLFVFTLGQRMVLRKINGLDITIDSLFSLSYVYLVIETNFIVATAIAIKIFKLWLGQQEEKHEIEKRNLKTELSLLRSQLHPHFLFNTMNNLYALSMEESGKTSEGIARISDLLSSVLYECNEAEIPIEKEVALIRNYIHLEEMRYDDRLQLEFDIIGELKGKKIAPMLFFTFVENCFKHGSSCDQQRPYIKIILVLENDQICFSSENSKPAADRPLNKERKGIGLANVKKRLEILYPNRYTLDIQNEDCVFKLSLTIRS